MMKTNAKRKLLILFSIVLTTVLALTAMAVYAWYTNVMHVYTTDGNPDHLRIGMRINLLFDRLNPSTFAEGSTIKYPDGTETTFDADEDWGTAANPYIISLPRHMINLYALQESGYFYERYISQNYTNGEYNGGTSKPFFLVCETDATPACIDGDRNGTNITISPIGSDEYPFIGCVGGAQESGTATAPNDMTSISSIIANFTVEVTDDMTDIGLFGKIGYLGDENVTVEGDDSTFNGSISGVSDLLLYDIKIVSEAVTDGDRDDDHLWESDASPNVRYEEDHHVGILAGHVEYAAIQNISVYYTSDSVTAIDVDASGANYLSDSGIIGLVYNLNPATSGNSIGCATGTTIAGTAKGAGNEWGASIDMKTMFNRLRAVATAATSSGTYANVETVTIDEAAGTSTTIPTGTGTYGRISSGSGNSNITADVLYYTSPDGGSFVFGDRTDSYKTNYAMFHGKSLTFFPKTVTTITKKNEFNDAWYIHDGDNYLSASGASLSNATTEGTAVKWLFDASGHLYTNIDTNTANAASTGTNDIVKYYLNRTNTGALTLSPAASTVWNYSGSGNEFDTQFYTDVSGTNYYLSYNNGWGLTPIGTYRYISDGSGNYLSATASGVTNAASEAASVKWVVSDPTGSTTTISTYINDTRYYLRGDGSLGVGTSSFTWNRDGDVFYTTVQGVRYNLVYDGGWKVVPASGKRISDGSGHWLTATTTAVGNATEANAVVWQFSSNTGNTQIYTVLNGQKYYLNLNNNNALTVSTTEQTWNRNGNSFYRTSGNKEYYLTYDGSNWNVTAQTYFTINDGNGNYLRVTGANAFANGNSSNATHFYFATENGASSSGRISCTVGGTTYYLYNNNGALATTTTQNTGTQWQNNGSGRISSGNYAIGYDNGWKLISTAAYYLIYDNAGHYLNANSNFNGLTSGSDESTATRWNYSGGKISVTSGTTTYYLRINQTSTTGCNGTTYSYELQLSNTDSSNTWNQSGNNYYVRFANDNNANCYLRYNNNQWTCSTNQNEAAAITISQRQDDPRAYVVENNIAAPALTVAGYNCPDADVVLSETFSEQVTMTKTSEQTMTKVVDTQAGGNDTYFPLVADDTAPFAVQSKNTGYVVGGSHASYQSAWADVRFSSYFTFSDGRLTNSVNGNTYRSSRLEVLTRTYLSGGQRRISDSYNLNNTSVDNDISSISKVSVSDLGLTKYDSARSQLHDMFGSDGYTGAIYGMHFMDAAISMDNMITAPKVVINEQTYYNYQMPEDCIDFRLRTRGYINFFAGTYYMNAGYENNSFFSLNQIFRNSSNEITAIKRIAKIYGVPGNEKKTYIYLYGDGTYSSGSSSPVGNDGYVEVFDTDWIERPADLVEYAMYYFEIPVNAGEYALGSVEKQGSETARYGAYLCYLDIGTSAASHASMIGTIDFVYDNLSDKIVVVPDTNENDTSLNYYKPSLAIMYTENAADNDAAEIGVFTVNVTRTITSVNDANATLTSTFGGDDAEYLNVVAQHNGGDTIVKVYPS